MIRDFRRIPKKLNTGELYGLRCGINSNSTEMQSNIMPKNDKNNIKKYVYYCSIFINKFEQVEYLLPMFVS